jgi:hypothetical protein
MRTSSATRRYCEDRRDVEVDLGEVRPQVAGRHDDELGKRSVALDPDADSVCAQRAPACQAVAAAPACDVTLGSDDLAGVHGGDVLSHLHDLAHELMADDERRVDGVLRPLVPAVDVEVGAADARAEDPDQHVARTGFWLGHILQPQTRLRFCFDQRLHCRPIIGVPQGRAGG